MASKKSCMASKKTCMASRSGSCMASKKSVWDTWEKFPRICGITTIKLLNDVIREIKLSLPLNSRYFFKVIDFPKIVSIDHRPIKKNQSELLFNFPFPRIRSSTQSSLIRFTRVAQKGDAILP